MDSQLNLIDLNTELSCEPVVKQLTNDIDHQYVNCNGTESNSCLNEEDDIESTYSIFGAASCLSSLPNSTNSNNKDPFDMRMYQI